MENPITLNLSWAQIWLTAVIQFWIIIAPIIIIRKLNYLTNLMQAHFETDQEPS